MLMRRKLSIAWSFLAIAVHGKRLQMQGESFGKVELSELQGKEGVAQANPLQALVPLLLAFNPSPSPTFASGPGTSSAVGQSTAFNRVLAQDAGTQLSRRAALATGAAVVGVGALPSPALAYAGEGTMSKEDVLKIAEEKLTPLQQAISLSGATERPFTGETTNGYMHDNKIKGTYVGAISGAPLFESTAKYDSGTGWPSFYAAVPGAVIQRFDPGDLAQPLQSLMMGGVRTEIIDAKSGAHIGHVFKDGPQPTGLRYCMNAGAMTFVPDKTAESGRGVYESNAK